MDIRNIFFKFRSFTPIPIALIIIYNSEPMFPYNTLGIFLIVVGEIIRINAVRFAGGATRTRDVGAPYLCTTGPYSRLRNPIYLGNIIICTGIAFMAGGELMWELVIAVIFFLTFQYYLIISIEEEVLKNKFQKEYESYLKNVPKFLPNFISWDKGNKIEPKSLFKTIRIEKRTLQNLFFMVFLILFKP